MTKSKKKKTSKKEALGLVAAGIMTKEGMVEGVRQGLIAGDRTTVSWRLKNMNGHIVTPHFPSPIVEVKGGTLADLTKAEKEVVNLYKETLKSEIMAIYEKVRGQFCKEVEIRLS
jgi:hypothetical protein|tara:strand:+ start:702 stop:1046 length:345 start_codon:yes stop_codon:yes gene_type:complete